MFEKYLEKILKENLGQFLEEVDSKQLSVGIWSGKINIKNLKLKKGLLQKYHLPIIIRHSTIKGLSLKIPWKNLFGSPLVITIESVLILCQFESENISPEERIATMTQLINNTIKQIGQQLVEKSKQKSEIKQKSGLMDKFAYKMLDNLYLSIKNIHVRFEEKYSGKEGYSFGCSLQSIDMFAVGSNNEKVFIDRSKLSISQTLLRKKIQMKNLAIYCNYAEQNFIIDLPVTKNQKTIQQRLTASIYSREKENTNNKNNYILIMNVFGVIDQDYRDETIRYDANLNFEKLIVKLDKDVLNSAVFFSFKLAELNKKTEMAIFRKQLSKEDDLLFRKYCNAYLSDFKSKDIWNPKDKQLLDVVIANLHEEVIIEKVKYIVVNQMSVAQLAKFFALKGQDLDKGLLEVSKQIKDVKQPRIKMQLSIPQITLYLVNQFSESILQFNILDISLLYRTKIINENTVKQIDFSIYNVSAINNNLYIVSVDKSQKTDKFINVNAEVLPEMTNIVGNITSFNFYYDFETIFKINELFHLRQMDYKYKNVALDKIEILQNKVNHKISDSQAKMTIRFVITRPKLFIREGKISWNIVINSITCGYSLQEVNVSLESFKLLICKQKQEYTFVQPIDLLLTYKSENDKPIVRLKISPVTINFEHFIYRSLNNLFKYLFISKKQEILSKCTKSCQIFLKQNRWKKCFITLLDNHLYAWENESQYPLFNIRLRFVNLAKRGKVDILEVSDKKNIYQIGFKDQKILQEWKLQLIKITNNQSEIHRENEDVSSQNPFTFELALQKIHFKIKHHAYNRQEMKFSTKVDAISVIQLDEISINYVNSACNETTIASIQVANMSFTQNNEEFIVKLNQKQAIIKTEIIVKTSDTDCADKIINIDLSPLQIYYKPANIIRLLGFFNNIDSKNSIVNENFEQRLAQQNPNKILTQINININKITIIFQNKVNRIVLAKISSESVKINIILKYYELVIQGCANCIELFDMSNYPFTIYKHNNQQLIEKKIVDSDQYKNTITFVFEKLFQGSDRIKDNISTLADVKVSHLHVNYTSEVVGRFINYVNNQIIGVFNFAEFYPQFYGDSKLNNHELKRDYVKNESQLIQVKYLHKLGKEKSKLLLYTEKPMHFTIKLSESKLNLVSNHSTSQGICLCVQSIIITNECQTKEITTDRGILKAPTDKYKIEMSNIRIMARQNSMEFEMSNTVQEKIGVKISLNYFSRQLDLKYIYGQDLQIYTKIEADIGISIAKLKLNEVTLTSIRKIINNNLSFEDGLDFQMCLEYVVGNQSILSIDLHSEVLIIQLQLQEQKDTVLVQLGGFLYRYRRNQQSVKKQIINKYLIVNFTDKDQKYHQILTNRKIFGRLSNRGTLYTQLQKQNLLINLSNDTSFKYESTRNKATNNVESVLSAREMMFIVDMNFFVYLYKVKMTQLDLLSIEPVYKQEDMPMPKNKINHPVDETQIKLDKIVICCKVPFNDIILSILATIYVTIHDDFTQIVLPDLEAFISTQEQITCQQLSLMKKRTLLRQTHLKIMKNSDQTEINLGKCFFKISVNDFKSIFMTYQVMEEKYRELTRIQTENSISQSYKVREHSICKKKAEKYQPINISIENFESSTNVNLKDKQAVVQNLSIQVIPTAKQDHFFDRSQIEEMQKEYVYILDTMELMIVDDLNDFLTPLLYINCKIELNQQEKAIIQFYGDYFNLRNTYWQPIIQKNTILIDYSSKLTIRSLQEKEFININISSNFIENIFKTINHKELKSSRMIYTSHKVDKDEINSWILVNQLGEDIICEPLDGPSEKSIEIQKGDAQTLNFLSKEIVREFKQKQNQQIFVRVHIGERLTIKKLKINEMGLKRLNLGSNQSNLVIIKNLFVDLSKNIKYLTLSSEIIFQNKSDNTLVIKQSRYNKFIYLLPNKCISLPYYCTLKSIMYETETDKFDKNLQNLQKTSKIEINGKIFNIIFVKRKLKKYFSFIPLYKITNYLPFTILIHFKMKESSALLMSLELSSYEDQNSNYGYLYQQLQQLQVSLWIEGYQCTDFFQLNKLIEIKDYHNNPLTIKSEIYKDATPMLHIALMVNFIIRNQTCQAFDAFVDSHWVKNIKSGQYFISEHNQIVLTLNGYKSDLILLTKKNLQIPIKNKGEEVFRTESDYCIYKNKIQLDNTYGNRINFSITEILPMHLFRNDYKQAIVIKQNGSSVGQSQLIAGKSEENIVWYIDSNGKRRNQHYRLTIENSPYDWSCPINVELVRKCYFILRSKFNYKELKYCCVNVKKVKESYDISFKQLSQQEIPYLIKNNTKKYCIIIQNMKIALEPGQQSYFCWDDPTINQKKIKVCLMKLKEFVSSEKNTKRQEKINYQIKVDIFEQDIIKSTDQNLDIQVINQLNRQVFLFTDEAKEDKQTILSTTMDLTLPIRIALINNSSSPASHICDLTTQLHLHYQSYSTNKILSTIQLKSIQLDNQTKPLTYFPVILNTDISIKVERSKYLTVELITNSIRVNIEEDFITEISAFLAYLKSLTTNEYVQPQILQQQRKEDTFFISKLILPKITLELQIQTKKFSIETTINLDKPQISSYPWKTFPYPIASIAINILSHLSISPWAFITSFGKGISMLITQQQTSKGFQGFFQQLIGGFSNSINGMIGMIVGHDIQKVDNFIDGLNKGFWAFGMSLYEILPNFEGDFSPINIVKEMGTSVINLVFKPVTGILRMTLRISQGIKKTAKFEFGQSYKKFKLRTAIIFYNREQTFRFYNSADSETMNTLKKSLYNQLRYFYPIDLIMLEYKLRNQRYCFAIGAQEVLLFNVKSERMLWKLQIDKISQIEIHNLCTIQFITNVDMEGSSHDNKKKYEVDTNSQESVKRIIDIIEKAKKFASIEL